MKWSRMLLCIYALQYTSTSNHLNVLRNPNMFATVIFPTCKKKSMNDKVVIRGEHVGEEFTIRQCCK